MINFAKMDHVMKRLNPLLLLLCIALGTPLAPAQADTSVQPEVRPKAKNPPRRRPKRARRCNPRATPRYRQMVRRWQRVPKVRKPRYREGLRDLSIASVNTGKRVRLFPYLPEGELDPEALHAIEEVLSDKDSGAVHPVDPRLVKLLYKLADFFKARQINVISGYREVEEGSSESNHSVGKAVDFMIPGVPLGAVARKARSLGHVGVGLYPNSGFVHLDVRERLSYFWVDRSGPGKPSCMKRIQAEAAARFDRRWRPKWDEPRRHVNRRGKPLGAIERPPEPAADAGVSDAAPEQ